MTTTSVRTSSNPSVANDASPESPSTDAERSFTPSPEELKRKKESLIARGHDFLNDLERQRTVPHPSREPIGNVTFVSVEHGTNAGPVSFGDNPFMRNQLWITTQGEADQVTLKTLPNGDLHVNIFNNGLFQTYAISAQDVERYLVNGNRAGTIMIQTQGGDDTINLEDLHLSHRVSVQVHAGEGDDTVTGSEGSEQVFGGDGNDYIDGRGGNDDLRGDGGTDTIVGESQPQPVPPAPPLDASENARTRMELMFAQAESQFASGSALWTTGRLEDISSPETRAELIEHLRTLARQEGRGIRITESGDDITFRLSKWPWLPG